MVQGPVRISIHAPSSAIGKAARPAVETAAKRMRGVAAGT
jgi:hypothetical protein